MAYSVHSKNKWISQRIHKKYNKIHHASKHRLKPKKKNHQHRQRRISKDMTKDLSYGIIENHYEIIDCEGYIVGYDQPQYTSMSLSNSKSRYSVIPKGLHYKTYKFIISSQEFSLLSCRHLRSYLKGIVRYQDLRRINTIQKVGTSDIQINNHKMYYVYSNSNEYDYIDEATFQLSFVSTKERNKWYNIIKNIISIINDHRIKFCDRSYNPLQRDTNIKISIKYWLQPHDIALNVPEPVTDRNSDVARIIQKAFVNNIDMKLQKKQTVKSFDIIPCRSTHRKNYYIKDENLAFTLPDSSNCDASYLESISNECVDATQIIKSSEVLWEDEYVMKQHWMRDIVFNYTNHAFDGILGLILIMERYINQPYICSIEMQGKLWMDKRLERFGKIINKCGPKRRNCQRYIKIKNGSFTEMDHEKVIVKLSNCHECRVDIFDIKYVKWYKGKIIKVDKLKQCAKVSYDGYSWTYDEWIRIPSPRIAPLNFYTNCETRRRKKWF